MKAGYDLKKNMGKKLAMAASEKWRNMPPNRMYLVVLFFKTSTKLDWNFSKIFRLSSSSTTCYDACNGACYCCGVPAASSVYSSFFFGFFINRAEKAPIIKPNVPIKPKVDLQPNWLMMRTLIELKAVPK